MSLLSEIRSRTAGLSSAGFVFLLLLAGAAWASGPTSQQPCVIVIAGASGDETYGREFRESAGLWAQAAKAGDAQCIAVGLSLQETNDLEKLHQTLAAQPVQSGAELWLVLLGHGTWDGKEARFNLRGPDLSATELAALLKPFHRPIAVINTASASAPFLKALAATNRIVVTATKSGAEENYARFGKYISKAICSPEADLDKDGQTSLLEAFLYAARQTAEFYKTEGRLATEHALIDDNGDGLGTPADWFRGIRPIKSPAEGSIDGLRAHQWHLIRSATDQLLTPEQRRQRDAIELRIAALRQEKPSLGGDDYYTRLEKLLTELSPFVAAGNTNKPSVKADDIRRELHDPPAAP